MATGRPTAAALIMVDDLKRLKRFKSHSIRPQFSAPEIDTTQSIILESVLHGAYGFWYDIVVCMIPYTWTESWDPPRFCPRNFESHDSNASLTLISEFCLHSVH